MLVADKVSRNEKFLASIASGKWILHKSYFDACREENKFVKVTVSIPGLENMSRTKLPTKRKDIK